MVSPSSPVEGSDHSSLGSEWQRRSPTLSVHHRHRLVWRGSLANQAPFACLSLLSASLSFPHLPPVPAGSPEHCGPKNGWRSLTLGTAFGPMVPNSIIQLTNIPGSKASFVHSNKFYSFPDFCSRRQNKQHNKQNATNYNTKKSRFRLCNAANNKKTT